VRLRPEIRYTALSTLVDGIRETLRSLPPPVGTPVYAMYLTDVPNVLPKYAGVSLGRTVDGISDIKYTIRVDKHAMEDLSG
jgi:hypothetical protein